MGLLQARWISKDANSLVSEAGALAVKVTGAVERSVDGINISNISITNAMLAGSISDDKLASSYVYADGTRAFTNVVSGVNPVDDAHLATKEYCDQIGWIQRNNCRLATSAALPACSYQGSPTYRLTASANGALTIDGTTPVVGNRVLVKDETGTNATRNGIYVVTQVGDAGNPWILTRASDFVGTNVRANSFTFIEEGSANSDSGWVMTSDNPTLDITELYWTQFSGSSVYNVDPDGLNLSLGTISVEASDIIDGNYGLQVSSNDIRLKVDPVLDFNSGTGALKIADDGIKDTHLDFGTGLYQINNTSFTDGSTYAQVFANQLVGGVYKDATTSSKGIAQFAEEDFDVSGGIVLGAGDIDEIELFSGIAGAGLSGAGGAPLAVGAASGIEVSANAVALGVLSGNHTFHASATYALKGIKDPIDAHDVATKHYIDVVLVGNFNNRQVETFSLSASDISNKYVVLASVPANASRVAIKVRNAVGQYYGLDFQMDGANADRLTWSGLGLDGVLIEGDQITVTYDV